MFTPRTNPFYHQRTSDALRIHHTDATISIQLRASGLFYKNTKMSKKYQICTDQLRQVAVVTRLSGGK
jgi:hypothetical protein